MEDGTENATTDSAPVAGPRGRLTIRDIAEMTGLSRSTVSLALNGSMKLRPETKEAVRAVVERTGYRPNPSARALASRRSDTVMVLVPRLAHVFSDFYFSEALSGIMDELASADLHMLVEATTPVVKAEGRALGLYRQHAVDGALAVGNLTTDTYLQDLTEAGCPVVLVNSHLPGVPRMLAANEQGAFDAVRHLHGLGHRRVAFIRGPDSVTTAVQRTAGYFRAVRELGLDDSADLVALGYFDESSGHAATRWLLSRPGPPPTAIFTTNDLMALGALEALAEAGLDVPGDVSVFGGDDNPLARYARPQLTTLRQDMYGLGKAACRMLLNTLRDDPAEEVATFPVELVHRASCGPARRG